LIQYGGQVGKVRHHVRIRDLSDDDVGDEGAVVKRHGANVDNVFWNGECSYELHRLECFLANVRQVARQKSGRQRRV
jgi:hypothetical protein